MNLGEAKKRVLMLIDEYSTRGVINTGDNIADYELKINSYFDAAQLFIAETKHIKRSFLISQYLPISPSIEQFDSVPHMSDDITVSGKGYAYHFAVDDSADVYIEAVDEDGTITGLDYVYARPENGFESYKGIIDYDGNIQLRFSGDSYYNIKDIAIFPVRYSHYDKIPNFSRYINYVMPNDFLIALRVDLRHRSEYRRLEDFKWENPHTIGISAFAQGDIRIEYAAKPKEITETTSDTYEFEIGAYEQNAMIDYVAAQCLQHTNYNVFTLLMQSFNMKMANSQTDKTLRQTKVKRVW